MASGSSRPLMQSQIRSHTYEDQVETGATMTEPDNQDPASEPADDSSNAALAQPELGTDGERMVAASYQAKLDEVADLITRVRHEINNPLTGVLGQAQLLLREDLSEKARKRAETIEQLAIRIRDIVAQLRQVQKASN